MAVVRVAWIVVVVGLASGCRDERRPAERAVPAVPTDAAVDEARALRQQVDRLDQAGELAPALQAAERLVGLARAKDPAALGSALEAWGRLLFQAGRWPEAEAALDEAISLPVAKTDKALRSSLLFQLGSVYAAQRRNDEAIDVVEQSLALSEELYGKDSPASANTAEVLAAAYDYAGRYPEAEALFRRAIAVYERDASVGATDRGRALANLALNLEYQKRDDDALGVYRRALPLLEQATGYDRTGLAEAQAGIARIYHRKPGKLKDAEASYRAALATRRAALGDDHPSVAMDHHNLAVVLEDQRRLPEAIDACMRAEDIRAKTLAPEHPHRMETEGLCERLRKAARTRRR